MLKKFKSLGLLQDPRRVVSSLAEAEIEWLMSLAVANHVQRSLETGFGNGHSAAALLLAGVVEHTAIEISPGNLAVAQSNVAKARASGQYCRLLMGSSDIRLSELVQRGETFDLMLIDGGHSYEEAFIDMHYARSLLEAGSLLVVDDVSWPGVSAAITWHATNFAKVWQKVEPPDVKGREGFDMVTFKRSGHFWIKKDV